MSAVIFRSGKVEVPSVPRAGETHARSIFKAISWRMTGTLDTFIIGLLVTGKVTLAGSIAAIEILSKVMLYYFHERAWALVHWGRH